MASGRAWTNICPDCGRHVEILNGDFDFSMELHKQSHKSLDYVNSAINRNLDRSAEKINNTTKLNCELNNYCHICEERFDIINNDFNLSFQLHAQRHKPLQDNTDASSDHSSTSSVKSRGSQNKMKEKEQTQPVLTSILDAVFHTMPIGLKAHRGFIIEQDCSKAICNLCEITIAPVFSVSEHLKTKLHEDNTIQAIKTIMSSELHDQMEFISFYGSNLCCNLCRCKIDLYSENMHKTVVNIFAHNAGKAHLGKKTVSKDTNQSDKTLVILKSLALVNPLVNENQHLIEHKTLPYFKCKLCDKQIAYSEQQKELINNFTTHFNSSGHVKSASAAALLTKWDGLNITGKENHNFVVSKQNVYCVTCNSVVEPNLDKLLYHIRSNSALYGKGQSESIPTAKTSCVPNVQNDNLFPSKEENKKSNDEKPMNKSSIGQPLQKKESSAKLNRLLQALPVQFRNMIIENNKGETLCSVCKCVIPATTYNMMTHLKGSSHMKKQNEAKSTEEIKNHPQPSKTQAFSAQAKEPLAKEFDLLVRNHPVLYANKEYFARYNGENTYICVLCGTIIQTDLNSLLRNLLSHVESQDHVCKVQLREEMSQLLPRCSNDMVRELFNCIPLSFQKDMKYIKAPEVTTFVFCEICCVKIPRHRVCLLEHLEGGYHESSVKRLGKIQQKKILENKPDDCDALFRELVKNNNEIRMNSWYICKTNDDYLCKICKAVIKTSCDINILEVNFVSHINGKKHKKNVEDEFSDMLDKIQLSSPVVQANRIFLKRENDKVVCTLCPCHMSLSDSVDTLKYNLEVHLHGNVHCTRILEANISYASSAVHDFLQNVL